MEYPANFHPKITPYTQYIKKSIWERNKSLFQENFQKQEKKKENGKAGIFRKIYS